MTEATEAAAAAATAAAAAAAAAATTTTPWYEGKVDAETIGFWQNKVGADLSDPVKVAAKLTENYRGAEKLLGVPHDQLVRWPKDAADETNWAAINQRLGVPKEAKEYDFAGIKFSNGAEIDSGLADTMRAALHAAKLPKDRAPDVMKAVIAHMEKTDTGKAAELTATIQAETQALDRNWGKNKEANMFVARGALEKLGTAAGLKPDQIQSGWDALSKVGGVGASYALEMLRIAGSRMGEDKFVTGGGGGQTGVLSREQALNEIETLKKDPQFRERYLKGGAEETKRMKALHSIAYPSQAA